MGQPRDTSSVTFSFVAPVFNEAGSLPEFHAQLKAVADKLGEPYEIILVNDGSRDESLEVIHRLAREDEHVKYVDLSRNFGHQEALTAGYDYASGQAVISLDSDCQHPPELIPELVARWREGYEVAYTVRQNVADLPAWKRAAARWFYRCFGKLSGLDVTDQADFRLLDRRVVRALRQVREKARFLRGLVKWVGFRQVAVPYQALPRYAGRTGYSLRKMLRVASAGLLNFSVLPLRLAGGLGAALLGGAVLYALVTLVLWRLGWSSLTANLVVLALGMLGVQLAALGLLGEYVGRIYDEAKDRPIYVVRDAVGFEQAAPKEAEEPTPASAKHIPSAEPRKIRLFT